MNKSFIYGLVLLMIAGMALAEAPVNPISTECINHGFAYGLARYDASTNLIEPVSGSESHNIAVTLAANKLTADWTSDYEVDGVIVNSAIATGQGNKAGSVSDANGINQVIFCGNSAKSGDSFSGFTSYNGEALAGVPEFSTWALGAAIIGVGLGLAFLRKR